MEGGGITSVNGDATAAATVLTSYIDMKHKLVCSPPTDDTTAFNAQAGVPGAVLMMPANLTCIIGNGILAAGVIVQGANTTLKAKAGVTGVMLYGNFTDGVGTRGDLIIDGNSETGLTYPIETDNSANVSFGPGLVVKNAGATGGGAAAFQGGIKMFASTGTVTGVHVTNVAGYCLELNTLSNVQVIGGEFDHCYKDGIVLASTGVGVSISQANVHDIYDGGPSGNLGSYGNGIYCSGAVTCTVSNVTGTNIEYTGVRAGNSSAVNVTGGTWTRTGDWAGYSEFASGPANFTGMMIIDPLGGGINVANGADSNGNWNNTISGNTVQNAQGSSTNGTTTPVYGDCFFYTTRTIVSNNTCNGAYWGILGETTTATDSPTPGVQVSGNAFVDTRPVTIVGTSPSGTISVGDQVYVGANWGAATKQGIISVVADSTHITVKTLLGFFAAADALKDNTAGHTTSTLTVSTVTGPTKQELTVNSVTNVKLFDTAALGSGSTASAGVVTCVPAASSPATNSPGCPTALHIIVSLRPNAAGLNVLFPASGTLTTSSGGSVTISAATNTLINMQVPMVTNTDTTANCQQQFFNNLVGSYILGPIRAATGSPPSVTTAAIGSGVCAVNGGVTPKTAPATYLNCAGLTDAAPCIRTAITGMASTGGVLIAEDHATYTLSSTAAFQGQNCIFVMQNPIYFQLNNATFNVSSSIHDPDRLACIHSLTNTYRDGTGLKVMSAAHRGDVSLTLTTTTDGAAFTVGDIIFIEGNGDADLGNQSINIVTAKAAACGSGTCTLSLEWPLAKDFTITPRVKDGQSGTGFNYIFEGPGTINNGELQAFIGTQIRNLQINDITIWSNTMSTSNEPFQLNSMVECQMRNNTVTSSSGTIFEAAASSTHCVIEGNHVHTILSSAGVAPTGSAIGLGEGNESTRLVNNWCSIEGNAAATMGCLDITASFDAVISGNHFACGPGMSGACIITDNGGVFAAVNASITGNTINSNMAGLYAAQLSGSTAAGWATNLPGPITFTGNTITASNDNGIHCTGWCQISGNSLFIASGYGIIIEGTAGMNASISSNLIAASAAATGFNGIIVVDPGAQQTNDPVIIGNQIVNYTTPISIQTPTNNALILICNNSLTVNTITCSQSGTGSNLTGQTIAQSGVTLFTPPVTGSYRVTYYAKVTTPGTTSILGGTTGFFLHYTDGTDSVAQNLTLTEANQSGAILSIGTGNVTNTTAAVVYGSAVVKAKVGVAMTYDFGRTSTGTAMQYAIKVTVEAVTP